MSANVLQRLGETPNLLDKVTFSLNNTGTWFLHRDKRVHTTESICIKGKGKNFKGLCVFQFIDADAFAFGKHIQKLQVQIHKIMNI